MHIAHEVQFRSILQKPTILFCLIPFAHWFGAGFISLYMIAISMICVIDAVVCQRVYFKPIHLWALACTLFFVTVSLARYEGTFAEIQGFSSLSFAMLTLQATQLFVLIFIMSFIRELTRNEIINFLKYTLYILIASIIIEALATNALGVPSKIFPTYRDSVYYVAKAGTYQRPFGLTGSAPMNGSILVVIFWFYLGLEKITFGKKCTLHALVWLALALNLSGQAILSHICASILYIFRFDRKGVIKFCACIIGFHIILLHGEMIYYKLSYEYLFNVLQYANLDLIWQRISATDVLFGAMKNVKSIDPISAEVFPVFALGRFGGIQNLLFWGTIFFPLLRKRVSKGVKVALVSVLIGSLHYASVLIIILQVPLALLLTSSKIEEDFDSNLAGKE